MEVEWALLKQRILDSGYLPSVSLDLFELESIICPTKERLRCFFALQIFEEYLKSHFLPSDCFTFC